MGSVFGRNLKITLFGQSHGAAIGAVIDGLPAGHVIDLEKLQVFLDERSAKGKAGVTLRKESDRVRVLSGLNDGQTCGSPLCLVIDNADVRQSDYSAIFNTPRPSHADYPLSQKYGKVAVQSGGGHNSGRLTAALCAAGGVCMQLMEKEGVKIGAHHLSIGQIYDRPFDTMNPEIDMLSPSLYRCLDKDVEEKMKQEVALAMADQDSIGGTIEVAAVGLPVGIGGGIFQGLDNRLAQAVFSVPGVKGVDFGQGFHAAFMRGSEHNDPWIKEGSQVRTQSNHAGGIVGGMSTGMPVLLQVALKPTPSIEKEQRTLNIRTGEQNTLSVTGRHDPCIALRALPAVVASVAIALYDALLDHKLS
jgi:chorismate synthase